jgi:hypothetical protein
MSSSGTFSGSFVLDDEKLSDLVYVFMTDFEVALSDSPGIHRNTVHLHPFVPQMFSLIGSADRMREGVRYSISGNRVGGVSRGPLGHPGDGEYDSWSLKNFDLRGHFTKSHLEISVRGVSEEGSGSFSIGPLAPRAFHVRFVVPREELVKFLRIAPEPAKYFNSYLDACEN